MANRDIRDIMGGLAIMAVGIFVAWHAYIHYDIGELRRMGPGFFPVSLGALLAVLGFFIALPAFFRPGSPVQVEVRTLVAITLSVVTFAFLLKTLGVILATMASILIATFADRDISWKTRGLVAVGVAAITWIVFVLSLGMSLPVWPWSP